MIVLPRLRQAGRRMVLVGLAVGLAVLGGGCSPRVSPDTSPPVPPSNSSNPTPVDAPFELSGFLGQDSSLVEDLSAECVDFWWSDRLNDITAIELEGVCDYSILGVTAGDVLSDAVDRLEASGWEMTEQVRHGDGVTTTRFGIAQLDTIVGVSSIPSGVVSAIVIQLASRWGPILNARTPAGVPPSCERAGFPVEVDRDLVCDTPSDTVVLPSFEHKYDDGIANTVYGFKSPDGNLACSWGESGTVVCKAVEMDVAFPAEPRITDTDSTCERGLTVGDEGSERSCGSGLMFVDVIPDKPAAPVLDYGQTIVSTDVPITDDGVLKVGNDPVACHSAESGITCWNTLTLHGFKIGREVAVFW